VHTCLSADSEAICVAETEVTSVTATHAPFSERACVVLRNDITSNRSVQASPQVIGIYVVLCCVVPMLCCAVLCCVV
jgi:hypothetical protein